MESFASSRVEIENVLESIKRPVEEKKMSANASRKGMCVVKRDGTREPVSFDKILKRLTKLQNVEPALTEVDVTKLAQVVVGRLSDGISTCELDVLACRTSIYRAYQHPDYAALSARITISNHHKKTEGSILKLYETLASYVHPKTELHSPLISSEILEIVRENEEVIQGALKFERDYLLDYFGFSVLERGYLVSAEGIPSAVERPQHMWMRVALQIHGRNMELVLKTYEHLSLLYYTHATPTLMNSGSPRCAQPASCFIMQVEDSIDGMYSALKDAALISKNAGGISFCISGIRPSSSYIAGSAGSSSGVIPMLRVWNETAKHVDQGGGKRKGAFAAYIEPWHPEIEDFLDMRKNTKTKEDRKARDLFSGLWIPDLFMERVYKDEKWSLFCPKEAPNLSETWGKEFEKLYLEYEKRGKARKVVEARKLWNHILDTHIETGTPYMCYKDHANGKNNLEQFLIRSSNLCTEIMEPCGPAEGGDEIAVCNLASVCLSRFVDAKSKHFDHQKLYEITREITRNLNNLIDNAVYPTESAKRSNMKHRPIGIGCQGFADALALLKYPFDSKEALELTRDIAETMYFAALTESCQLAKEYGPHPSFDQTAAKRGLLSYDLWKNRPAEKHIFPFEPIGPWRYDLLKKDIAKYGLRNGLTRANMPTASTSQVMGQSEGMEPRTTNMFLRRVLSGSFPVINEHLVRDLIENGLWTPETTDAEGNVTPAMCDKILYNRGSIQDIDEIPQWMKNVYKTVWEIGLKVQVDLAAATAVFLDQSNSLTLYVNEPDHKTLTNMHFYAYRCGLKTGMYYMRVRPPADPVQVTARAGRKETKEREHDSENDSENEEEREEPSYADELEPDICRMQQGCFSCGS